MMQGHLSHHAEGCLDELVEVLVRKSRKLGARVVTELQLHDLSMALQHMCTAGNMKRNSPSRCAAYACNIVAICNNIAAPCAAHQLFIDAVARAIVIANLPIWTCRQQQGL
jgi:hypothetical protein